MLAAKRHEPGARERLVEMFLPPIGGVARVYRSSGTVAHAELMQQGVVGLLQALERYDAERSTPFWAYASWWVRRAMQELVADLGRPVVLSDRALRQLARVKSARRQHLRAHKREATTSELVAASGLTRDKVEALFAVDRPPRGLDEPMAGDPGSSETVGDMLPDPAAQDGYDRVDRRSQVANLRSLPDLCQRERAVLAARYGLTGRELTLREIGRELRLSPERVRQIQQEALDKLRAAVRDHAA